MHMASAAIHCLLTESTQQHPSFGYTCTGVAAGQCTSGNAVACQTAPCLRIHSHMMGCSGHFTDTILSKTSHSIAFQGESEKCHQPYKRMQSRKTASHCNMMLANAALRSAAPLCAFMEAAML